MLLHRAFLRLIGAVGTEKDRFQLTGIGVKRSKHTGWTEACATSGRLLAVLREKEPDDELPSKLEGESTQNASIIPPGMIKKLAKIVQRNPLRPILEYLRVQINGDRLRVETIDDDLESTVVSGRPIPGPFVDYDAILQDARKPALCKIRLNPRIFQDALKVTEQLRADLGADGTSCVVLHVPDQLDSDNGVKGPIRLEVVNEANRQADVLIMPMARV